MKIIHTADVHLGAAPDKGYPWSRERAFDIWNTFERLIDRIRFERPELFVISGDLFHAQPNEKQIRRVGELFASIPETTVAFCAGNHDYIRRDSQYLNYKWSKNVYPFFKGELTSVSVKRIDTRIYGLSYHDIEARDNLYKNAKPCGYEKYHILLMHAGDKTHSPIDRSEIAASEFDYIAMGHIHRMGFVVKNKAAFSGALEPLDRNDTGEHGYLEVELDEAGARVSFVQFANASYKTLNIYADQSDTVFDVEEKIKKAAFASGSKNIYSIYLNGNTSVCNSLDMRRLWSDARVIEISGGREDLIDYEALSVKYRGTILAEFINSFKGSTDRISRMALEEGTRGFLMNL